MVPACADRDRPATYAQAAASARADAEARKRREAGIGSRLKSARFFWTTAWMPIRPVGIRIRFYRMDKRYSGPSIVQVSADGGTGSALCPCDIIARGDADALNCWIVEQIQALIMKR